MGTPPRRRAGPGEHVRHHRDHGSCHVRRGDPARRRRTTTRKPGRAGTARPARPRPGPPAAARAARRHGRVVRGGRPAGPGLRRPRRADRGAVRGMPLRRPRRADVPYRRPGPMDRRRTAPAHGTGRRPGEDPGFPDRARRGRGRTGRPPAGRPGGGGRPRGHHRRQTPRRLRRPRGRLPRSDPGPAGRAARPRRPPAARPHGPVGRAAPAGRPAADGERKGGPLRPPRTGIRIGHRWAGTGRRAGRNRVRCVRGRPGRRPHRRRRRVLRTRWPLAAGDAAAVTTAVGVRSRDGGTDFVRDADSGGPGSADPGRGPLTHRPGTARAAPRPGAAVVRATTAVVPGPAGRTEPDLQPARRPAPDRTDRRPGPGHGAPRPRHPARSAAHRTPRRRRRALPAGTRTGRARTGAAGRDLLLRHADHRPGDRRTPARIRPLHRDTPAGTPDRNRPGHRRARRGDPPRRRGRLVDGTAHRRPVPGIHGTLRGP